MTTDVVRARYREALDHHRAAVDALVPLAIEMAFTTLREALPTAHAIETRSEFTEDWLRTLRIERVLDETGTAIFDIDDGHPDPVVEEAIALVGVDYLDLLLDLTGDQYTGGARIARPADGDARPFAD